MKLKQVQGLLLMVSAVFMSVGLIFPFIVGSADAGGKYIYMVEFWGSSKVYLCCWQTVLCQISLSISVAALSVYLFSFLIFDFVAIYKRKVCRSSQ